VAGWAIAWLANETKTMAKPWQSEAAKRILFLLPLLLIGKVPVRADLITTASVAAFNSDGSVTFFCSESGTTSAGCSTVVGSAGAGARYGEVAAGAQAREFGDGTGGVVALAAAVAEDRLTITGGTGPGTLQVSFHAGAHGTGSFGFLGFGCPPREGCFDDFVGLVPFAFGVPFDMTMSAEASGSFPPSTAAGPGGGASVGLDLFSVVDSQGRPIPNVRILAQSGTAYPSLILTTPEPSSLILFASGLGLLFSIGRRRLIG
jgi:hypothetical protein